MKITNTLHVMPAGDCWAVDWSNTSNAALILALFGTTLIPTPFLRTANPEFIARHFERLNPDYKVEVKGGVECN